MKDLLSTRDISRLYFVTPATVLNWIRAGKLRAYSTPGGHYRVRRKDLRAFALLHNMLPLADVLPPDMRLLFVELEVETFEKLRDAICARWPAVQVEYAHSAMELGWYLAKMNPTHVIGPSSFSKNRLLDQHKRLANGNDTQSPHVMAIPKSLDGNLREWIEGLALVDAYLDSALREIGVNGKQA